MADNARRRKSRTVAKTGRMSLAESIEVVEIV